MSDAGTTNNTDSVVASKLPNGGTLPFPPTPSASVAGRTMQESTYAQRVTPPRLHEDPPNIVVILIDDAGPGLPTTLGGEVRTATMDRICAEGVSYNRFHTTAMCSPTRASLLTGRNHHEIGNGQIAELANDWDGYSGHIPPSSALIAEVLKDYGYSTAAFGKWHNTPAEETTAAGPFENWPTGLGFEYFYGFLAGEASQYEPNLVRNTTVVLPPKTPEEGYHLSEDLADDAIGWLRNHKALQADKPFFMYWASGCLHGPHHVMKEWADKYAGKFDDGWDAYRERVFDRAKEKGWIPHDCELTERDETLASWESIPEDEKPFQRRLMEVAAGYAEHVDVQVGRLADELDRLGYAENTIFIYIWGDNGSSGEGQNGTIAELLAQNGIPSTVRQHIDALDELGGLDVLGSPLVDNQYHAGWMASAFGPRAPWLPGAPPGIATWTPDNDRWELYHLDEDWSQAHDLADQMPEKLAQMRELFAIEAARNAVLPVGGGLWVLLYHPELRIAPPYQQWEFPGNLTRMPEFCAPALGTKNNTVTIEADLPPNANGVLYALGGVAGGVTCYLDDGYLCYEYNLFILTRTKIRSAAKLGAGHTIITVETRHAEQRPAGPLDITLRVGSETLAQGQVPVSAPLLFTANDCLDIGVCLGSPVSMDYYERAPFPFEGHIERVHVAYT